MSKIYTKTGDRGQTSLLDGTRVEKNDRRVETYGTVDELNAVIGVVLAELADSRFKIPASRQGGQDLKKELGEIQKDLFEIGSALANPKTQIQSAKYFDGRIKSFEHLIDEMTNKMPVLSNFILPGGGKAGAQFHVARTICRRVERRVIALMQEAEIDGVVIRYVNRLSDLLFTMSRYINFLEKKNEVIWVKR